MSRTPASPDFDHRIADWLEDDPDHAPGAVLGTVLAAFPSIPQRRASRVPWRFQAMNRFALLGAAAATIAVVGLGGLLLASRPSGPDAGTGPTPSPTPSPIPSPTPSPMILTGGTLTPGSYVTEPFWRPGSDWCLEAPPGVPSMPPSGCTDSTSDDSVRITIAVPEGWAGLPDAGVWLPIEENSAPGGAALIFSRGAWLHSDPCLTDDRIQAGVMPDIEVGRTVDDFANAIADHPLLDATTPIDVTLGGHSGKYLDLQLPADLTGCDQYRPWEPGIYAQGPSHRWHLWILDVDGVRVVVQSMDFPGTSAQDRAELRAMVESIQIER